jgi:hypothetical protein
MEPAITIDEMFDIDAIDESLKIPVKHREERLDGFNSAFDLVGKRAQTHSDNGIFNSPDDASEIEKSAFLMTRLEFAACEAASGVSPQFERAWLHGYTDALSRLFDFLGLEGGEDLKNDFFLPRSFSGETVH